MRTEPPSPRQSVLADSASRHVITTWDTSAGTTPAPRSTTAQRPRTHHAVLRAYLPWLAVHGSSPGGFARDPYGGTRAGFSATTELNRGDFGISTNVPLDGGGVLVGDRIQVFIEIEAVLNPPQPGNP